MKKILATIFVSFFLFGIAGTTLASEFGTKAEAEALVKKAVAYLKAQGKDKAFAEISNPKGRFIDRDLYVVVYDMKGTCVAHGFNQKMIGKDLIDMKDPDGKEFVKERVEFGKTKDKFWQDYKFTNPVTKKIEQKAMYMEKVGDVLVGAGAYAVK
ncbi:MAG: cache domain-containing protein [Smithellaceae bacterium]|nr:cache domain-containing protein [Smithellaceae bacterium]